MILANGVGVDDEDVSWRSRGTLCFNDPLLHTKRSSTYRSVVMRSEKQASSFTLEALMVKSHYS
ncbi:MAG: hypothetical protein QXN15_09145 [Candidatus Jordarchaeales archaeon]|nr:hypothetical protein [Candidatus Jordarchaeia archaeon]